MDREERISLSRGAAEGIGRLEEAGYTAYAVGGCVRDALLGKAAHDFDLCTSALPEQIQQVFRTESLFTVGIRHGTVGVVLAGEALEITTFRTDGAYSDGRHPDSVCFAASLDQDLKRRDFTVNAMAYHPKCGIVDLFGGREDLKNGILRCVGDPERRFSEDALRILRALRFAAVFGFRMEEKTERAAFRMATRLTEIAPERVQTELIGLLKGTAAAEVTERYAPIFSELFPGLTDTLLMETGKKALCVLRDPACGLHVRLAAFARIATAGHSDGIREFAARLRLPREKAEYLEKTAYAGRIPHSMPELLRKLRTLGTDEQALDRMEDILCAAGAAGEDISDVRQLLWKVRSEKLCFTRAGTFGLAVNGDDLHRLGISDGEKTGMVLDRLLDDVTEGKIQNDRKALLSATHRLLQ